jgi:DNA-directed RNA polymerase specialized sigma24 family protein
MLEQARVTRTAADTADDAVRSQIRDVCAPCREFVPHALECRLLQRGGEWFRQLFDAKRCQPHVFLERFLRKRVAARLGADAVEHVPDIVSEVVLGLLRSPPRGLPANHVVALRRLLAGRAQRALVDYWRGVKGRTRCGNCGFHHATSEGIRKCEYPDARHPWSGREVQAAVDPRTFDPPCERYASRRNNVAEASDGRDPLAAVASAEPAPDQEVAEGERTTILLDCLAAVQRQDPRAGLVLLLSYFKHKTNEEIAGVIQSTVRTVTRAKEHGLTILRQEFESRGIQFQDLA